MGEQGVLVHNFYNWKSIPTFGHTFLTHGSGKTNLKSLMDRAKQTGQEQGQWLNNDSAAEFLGNNIDNIDVPSEISIPSGLGQVIMPDGTIVNATKAIIVPKIDKGKKVIRTAYPIL